MKLQRSLLYAVSLILCIIAAEAQPIAQNGITIPPIGGNGNNSSASTSSTTSTTTTSTTSSSVSTTSTTSTTTTTSSTSTTTTSTSTTSSTTQDTSQSSQSSTTDTTATQSQPTGTGPISQSNSSTASPTNSSTSAAPTESDDSNGDSGSGLGTGSIIGLSVAGGVAVLGIVGFFVWKFTRKRFGDFDDNEAIKWPEINAHNNNIGDSHPLPLHNTGRSGFDTGSELSLSRAPSEQAGYSDYPGADPYAVPPLPHLNPNQPYRDDPSPGFYDPYRGPVPNTLDNSTDWHQQGEAIPMTQMGRTSPGPAMAYDPTGRSTPVGGRMSPGPGAAYGAGRASPGPQTAYGPGPHAAYDTYGAGQR